MLRRALVIVLAATFGAGCARPYAGPKTLAAVGTALLVGGGTAWVIGERRDVRAAVIPGAAATALGIAGLIYAGGWLAGSIACKADADCPFGEECREVPAPPGGVPYMQCVRRD
jgi:hypothetical protein